MADDITLNAGSGGAVIRTDDDGTAHWQYMKIAYGADNTQNIVTSTTTNPLPVALSDTDNAVLDTISSNTASGAVVGGGAEATALRVTLANDSTGVVSIDDNGGSLTIDGTVTANLSATDNAVLDTISSNTASGAVVGGGVEATALRVTLASDSTGVVSIDDNGGSITVDGTVTANLSATDNAVLDSIATNTTGLNGCVGGTELQVDVVASLPAGTNAIGKLAANSGVDIGDVDVTSISAGSNLIGDVGISGARTSGGTTPYYNDGTVSLTQVKASAGQLFWFHVMNLSSAVVYLQLFNVANGSITLGTTTPTNEFAIPTQGDTNGAGFTLSIPNGIAYGTAINYAVTTTQGGATTVSANACLVNLGYA